MSRSKQIIFFCLILLLAAGLRMYKVTLVPPGLYVDEAAIGVNAASILSHGVDEWGVPHPLWFKSFGDYKPPVYIYTTSISMFFLGKTELAVRLPSILAGIVGVVVIYFLTRELLFLSKLDKDQKMLRLLPLFSMFVLAIMPWHIHFSRGGFEVNLAVCFYLLASYFCLRFLRNSKSVWLLFSIIFYILTFYTYHTFKIITPLTVLLLFSCLIYKRIGFTRGVGSSFFLFVLALMPLVIFSFSPDGSARFSQTSAFVEYPAHTLFEKILVYPVVYLKNYLSFFSTDFLFSFGDGNGRHQIANFGLLNRWQIPFVMLGLYGIFLKQRKAFLSFFIAILFLLSPIPGALARPSPHSLRDLLACVPFAIVSGYGIYMLTNLKKTPKSFAFMFLGGAVLCELLLYLHFYYSHYTRVNLLDWGAANKEIVLRAKDLEKKYDIVALDSKFSNISIYYKFYNDNKTPLIINEDLGKYSVLKNKKVLYISTIYGGQNQGKLLESIYLPNANRDVYAELREIKL